MLSQSNMSYLKSGGVFGRYVIGYMLVVVVNMSYTVSVITAQLSMADTSLFEPNVIRYGASTIMSLVMLVILCQSLRIHRKDYYLLIIVGVADYIYSSCYYIAAVIMPVGDLEGMFVAMWMICTTMVDLAKHRTDIKAIFSAILASFGIFLMTQPWQIHLYVVNVVSQAPCVTMGIGKNYHSVGAQMNQTLAVNYTTADNYNGTISYPLQREMFSVITYTPHRPGYTNDTPIDSRPMKPYMKLETSSHALIFGYAMVAMAAICATINSNVAQTLMETYPVSTLVFWISIFEGLLSVALTYGFTDFPGYGGWSLPPESYCILLTFGYTIFGALMDISSYYTYNFLPVSHVAIALSFTIVILYAAQRTFMYNDGNANIFEVLGVMCTLAGAILSAVLKMTSRRVHYQEI